LPAGPSTFQEDRPHGCGPFPPNLRLALACLRSPSSPRDVRASADQGRSAGPALAKDGELMLKTARALPAIWGATSSRARDQTFAEQAPPPSIPDRSIALWFGAGTSFVLVDPERRLTTAYDDRLHPGQRLSARTSPSSSPATRILSDGSLSGRGPLTCGLTHAVLRNVPAKASVACSQAARAPRSPVGTSNPGLPQPADAVGADASGSLSHCGEWH
jgi:hypothetical protein